MLQRKKFEIRTRNRRRPLLRRPDGRRPPVQRRRLLLRQVAETQDAEKFVRSGVRADPLQADAQRPGLEVIKLFTAVSCDFS